MGPALVLDFRPLLIQSKLLALLQKVQFHGVEWQVPFFWVDPRENFFTILLTQLIPSGRYPIRPQAQTLVYSALMDLKKNS